MREGAIMKRYVSVSTEKAVILLLLFLVQLSLFGCANLGRPISADKRILITEKETSQGIFNDGEITVEYNVSLHGKNVTLAGKVNHRSSLDYLNVFILFLDATGNVLQQKDIYYSGYRVYNEWDADRSFRETLVVPPGTAGISFFHSSQPRFMQR
jgi:hypothetical protein